MRDSEQARLTDEAYTESVRLIEKHRSALDRVAHALLEKETLDKEELASLLVELEVESRAAAMVGAVRALPTPQV
jgi:cell division protease FtsH